MNSRLENKISMYFKVHTFFKNELPVLAPGAPALITVVAKFNKQLDALENLIGVAGDDHRGTTTQKHRNRTIMRDLALQVAAGLYGYAMLNGDGELAAKVGHTKSALDHKRDTDIHFSCQDIYDLANAHAAPLLPLGVSPAKLNDLLSAITSFRESILKATDKRRESKNALEQAYGIAVQV